MGARRQGERLERWADDEDALRPGADTRARGDEAPAPDAQAAKPADAAGDGDAAETPSADAAAEPATDAAKATVAAAPSVEALAEALDATAGRHATHETVRGILFDLDNTLVDFLRIKKLASAACARAMVAAGADFGTTPDQAGEMLFVHYLHHGIESDDAFATFVKRYQRNRLSYTQHQMDKVLAAGINAYLRTKDMLLEPYPGVRATLVELVRRGYRLGVVTDAPRLKAWQRLHAVGIADFFDVVVTRTDTGTEKPEGRAFLAALDALDMRPHEAAMVGDWAERDVAGGNRLGLFTVHARYGHAAKHGMPDPPPVAGVGAHETEPDFVAEAFSDLLDVFATGRR